jgi:hypothetical protein
VLLGLTDEEFFHMTPRQFHLLLEQYRHKTEYAEMLNGLVCSTVANWSMSAPKKPLTHVDFMPSAWLKGTKEKKKRVRKLNAEQVGNVFKDLFTGAVMVTANG